MVKLFRKVRKNLLSENKLSKYLVYAIGEIVLVVIGILIALQLNLWNEQRKSNTILTNNLRGVLAELKTDADRIGRLLEFYKESNDNRIAFINQTNYEQFSRDSLENSLENFSKELNLEYSFFKKIRNSGITEFGVYDDIMKDLIYYYEYAIPYLTGLTATYDLQVIKEDEYWRYNQDTYEFNYVDGLNSYQNEEVAKKELIKLLKSPTARNILKIDVRRNKFMIDRLSNIHPSLKKVISKLENVLKQSE